MPTSRSTTTADAESSSTSGASTSERSQSGSNPTDTGSPASDDAIPTSSSDPQPSSPTSSHSELSTPSKIGIGVGAGAGAIGLLAILWFVLTYLRKHNRKPPPPIEDQIRPKSFGSYAAMSEGAAPKSPDLQSPAWSGHKSELPADLSVVAPAPMSPSIHPSMSVEVEGSTPGPSGQTQPQARRQNIPSQSFFDANGVRQYVPYNPAAVGGHGRSASGQGAHEMPG